LNDKRKQWELIRRDAYDKCWIRKVRRVGEKVLGCTLYSPTYFAVCEKRYAWCEEMDDLYGEPK